jgi:hypothetical protein
MAYGKLSPVFVDSVVDFIPDFARRLRNIAAHVDCK